jgi:Domain of Unknown Function (DUF1206)
VSLQMLARFGLVAYAGVHLMIGLLALPLAWGASASKSADSSGALRTLAAAPLGKILLWLVAAGLLALALWQASAAIWGYRDCDAAAGRQARRGTSGSSRIRHQRSGPGRGGWPARICGADLRAEQGPGAGRGDADDSGAAVRQVSCSRRLGSASWPSDCSRPSRRGTARCSQTPDRELRKSALMADAPRPARVSCLRSSRTGARTRRSFRCPVVPTPNGWTMRRP